MLSCIQKIMNKQQEISINHLVILHRLLYGTIEPEEALQYLYKHLKEDADLADLGRPLKYQYKSAEEL